MRQRRTVKSGSRAERAIVGRIAHTLEDIGPLLPDGASVALVRFEFDAGRAVVRVDGDCPDCKMPASVFMRAIEARLRSSVPEVLEVWAVEESENA